MVIFDSTARRVKPGARRPFGAGLLAFVPPERVAATGADLDWWAANSPANLAAPDYDQLAGESAALGRLEAGIPCD